MENQVLEQEIETVKSVNNYEISNEESKLIKILKFVFIILVVFIHAYEIPNVANNNVTIDNSIIEFVQYSISKNIAKCAVPGFFLISSILLYKKDFKFIINLKKKFNSILIPYLILNTFWIMFFYIAQKIPYISSFFVRAENQISTWKIMNFLNAYTGFMTGYPILYPLWFLRDLFILNLFAKIIKVIIDRFPKTMFCAIVLFYFMPIFFVSKNAIIFWCLGYYVVKNNLHIKKIKIVPLIVIELILAILIFFVRNLKIYYLINCINIILSLMLIIQLSFRLLNCKFIEKLSKYSFSIFLFHEMNLTILKKIMFKILPKNNIMLLIEYFMNSIVIIIVCIMFAKFLEKYFSRLYNILMGQRKF